MALTDAEVSRLLVRIVGDNSDFRKALTESATMAQQQAKRIGDAVTHGSVGAFSSMRMMAHGIHVIGALAGEGGKHVHVLMQAFYGFRIASHLSHTLSESLGPVVGNLAKIGVGAGAFVAIKVLQDIGENSKSAQIAAKGLHAALAELSKPGGNEALADVKARAAIVSGVIEEMTANAERAQSIMSQIRGEQGVVGVIAGLFRGGWEVAMGRGPGSRQEDPVQKLKNAINNYNELREAMKDPAWQHFIEMQKELARQESVLGLGKAFGHETAANRLMMGGVPLSVARRVAAMDLSGELQDQAIQTSIVTEATKAYDDSVNKSYEALAQAGMQLEGYTADEARLLYTLRNATPAMQQDALVRSRVAEAYGEAAKAITALQTAFGGDLGLMRLARIAPDAANTKLRIDALSEALKSSAGAIKSSAQAIEGFGLPAWEALARRMTSLGAPADIVAMQRQFGAAQDSLKELEASLDPFEKFDEEARRLNRLLDSGTLSFDVYTRSIMRAGKEIVALGNQTDKVNAIEYRSADAFAAVRAQMDSAAAATQALDMARTVGERGPSLAERGAAMVGPVTRVQPDTALLQVQERILDVNLRMSEFLAGIANSLKAQLPPVNFDK